MLNKKIVLVKSLSPIHSGIRLGLLSKLRSKLRLWVLLGLLLSLLLLVQNPLRASNNASDNDMQEPKPVNHIMMPKGQYYIGDLCYVIRSEWSEVVDKYFKSQKDDPQRIIHKLNIAEEPKLSLVMFYTGSDGSYTILNGEPNKPTSISVDSGTVGIVDTQMLNPDILKENEQLGHVVEFTEDFAINVSKDGIDIGGLKIKQEE